MCTELSREESEKLNQIRPKTLGAAGRISGITPSSLVLLHRYLEQQQQQQQQQQAKPQHRTKAASE
jgi:tRNA uridine 5-carboxymethylaminomethyl modification enzyme